MRYAGGLILDGSDALALLIPSPPTTPPFRGFLPGLKWPTPTRISHRRSSPIRTRTGGPVHAILVFKLVETYSRMGTRSGIDRAFTRAPLKLSRGTPLALHEGPRGAAALDPAGPPLARRSRRAGRRIKVFDEAGARERYTAAVRLSTIVISLVLFPILASPAEEAGYGVGSSTRARAHVGCLQYRRCPPRTTTLALRLGSSLASPLFGHCREHTGPWASRLGPP